LPTRPRNKINEEELTIAPSAPSEQGEKSSTSFGKGIFVGTSVDPETEKHSVRHSNEDNDSISGVEEAEVTAGTISTFGAHSPETQRATTNGYECGATMRVHTHGCSSSANNARMEPPLVDQVRWPLSQKF
jgi:hypothetical protein